MWCPILPEHIWSKFKTADAAKAYLKLAPIVGSGLSRSPSGRRGSRALRRQQAVLGWRAQGRQVVFQLYTTRTPGAGSQARHIDLAISLPPAQIKPLSTTSGIASYACSQKAFDYLSFNC